jgi:hypothetical protein
MFTLSTAQQQLPPAKPYYIKNIVTGKIVSRFASLDNCIARCKILQSYGFKFEYGSLLSLEEALRRNRLRQI